MMTGNLQVVPRGEREVVMTRAFNAPPSAVFEAFTKPEFVSRWLLGPSGWTMPVCEMDVRVGGRYRWEWRSDKDGAEMGVRGIFREVTPPQRLVHTESWEQAWYGAGESIITTEFADQNGKTALTVTILTPSKQAREQMLKSGMEKGVAASYDRLEQMLQA
jgi:uncharacterized protein YndB with AHSA1/START domain